MPSTRFDYAAADVPIREDLPDAYRAIWQQIARPGGFWTGAQRVRIVAQARNARGCALCQARKEALSPEGVTGAHEPDGLLPAEAVEAIHRITTDPSRLSGSWYARITSGAVTPKHYVELLGVLVASISIDAFHRALGLALEPLPEPEPGDPDGYFARAAELESAYVPMLPASGAKGAEADLWEGGRTANVARAMSLVPDGVRMMKRLSSVQYLAMHEVANPAATGNRAIDRAQIELVAGRVSALSECFY